MSQPFDPGNMRIGDHERAQAVQALGEHYAQSRLTLAEYEERAGQAWQAVTQRDLHALFTDLPGPRPSPGVPAYPGPAGHPGPVWSDKSRIAAGVLQILLPLGIGRFYTGHTAIALGQLLLVLGGLITCGLTTVAGALWCLIDGIVLLANDQSTDATGRRLRS